MNLNKEDIRLLQKTHDTIERLGWEVLVWRTLFFAVTGYVIARGLR